MIKEALEYLFTKASENAKCERAKILDVPGLSARKVIIEHNGKLVDLELPAPVRGHTVESVDDLIAAAKHWTGTPVIWISGSQLTLVLDDADRQETVKLPLMESAVFKRIKALAANSHLDQPALIRLLRVEFRGAINRADILTSVRKVKFRSLTQGHADIQHGNESMGQSIENEVSGAGDIPELIVVETNLYANPGEQEKRYTVGLDLEIDAANRRFMLRPVPDEVEKVTSAALQEIRQTIEDQLPDVPVFQGRV